jgi:hypothetical protein
MLTFLAWYQGEFIVPPSSIGPGDRYQTPNL